MAKKKPKRKPKKADARVLVWTAGYRPFIMGGDVDAPIGIRISPGKKHHLGGGYFGYVVKSPLSGKTHIAEATTGAFVGGSLASVRHDIRTGDPEMMEGQVAAAMEQRKKVEVLDPDKFWGMFKDD